MAGTGHLKSKLALAYGLVHSAGRLEKRKILYFPFIIDQLIFVIISTIRRVDLSIWPTRVSLWEGGNLPLQRPTVHALDVIIKNCYIISFSLFGMNIIRQSPSSSRPNDHNILLGIFTQLTRLLISRVDCGVDGDSRPIRELFVMDSGAILKF